MIYGGKDGLADLVDVVRRTANELRPHKKEWDSIVVTGVSGLLVGPAVALRLHKPLVVVRKPGDHSHCTTLIENFQNIGKRYLFLDDFISTGTTKKRVLGAINKRVNPKDYKRRSPIEPPFMAAIYQYRDFRYGTEQINFFKLDDPAAPVQPLYTDNEINHAARKLIPIKFVNLDSIKEITKC